MQRLEDGFIVISCDFCGTDWDELIPMIEGHRGAVLCLPCLQRALTEARPGLDKFSCRLCLRENLPSSLPRWTHPAHPDAIACQDCIHQAAAAFDRDPDVDWKWQKNP
jgi:hypothetical protein